MGFAYDDCVKTAVLEMAKKVRELILLSVDALETRDKNAVSKLYEMDDTVDTLYRNRGVLSQKMRGNKSILKKRILDAMDPPY